MIPMAMYLKCLLLDELLKLSSFGGISKLGLSSEAAAPY